MKTTNFPFPKKPQKSPNVPEPTYGETHGRYPVWTFAKGGLAVADYKLRMLYLTGKKVQTK